MSWLTREAVRQLGTSSEEDWLGRSQRTLSRAIVLFVREASPFRGRSRHPKDLPGPCNNYYLLPYEYEDCLYVPTHEELMHAVQCYSYNSSDGGWLLSPAKKLIEEATALLVKGLPRGPYPEYEVMYDTTGVPWNWSSCQIAFRAALLSDEGKGLLRGAMGSPECLITRGALSDWLMERGLLRAVLTSDVKSLDPYLVVDKPAPLKYLKKPRKLSQRQIDKWDREFNEQAIQYLRNKNATNTGSNLYEFSLLTTKGLLRLSVRDGSVFSRFADTSDLSDVSPEPNFFSGKWNFYYDRHQPVASCVVDFMRCLAPLLIKD